MELEGGSLAIAALVITRNLSPDLMRGSKIIGFDFFEKVESFSGEENSPRLKEKFEGEMLLGERHTIHFSQKRLVRT